MAIAPRQRQRAVEPLADLLDQRERALHARMAARTGGHRDQPVGALLDRLLREPVVDDVVHHDAAPGMHRVVDVGARTERGDDDRHLVLRAHRHVVLEAVVALVHDLVDRERRGRLVRVRAGPSAASVSVISASHSSSCSAGRAFSAGIEPTTPALHCAITSFGLLMMNSGAPMIGSGKCAVLGQGMACVLQGPSERFERHRGDAVGAFDDGCRARRAPCDSMCSA